MMEKRFEEDMKSINLPADRLPGGSAVVTGTPDSEDGGKKKKKEKKAGKKKRK